MSSASPRACPAPSCRRSRATSTAASSSSSSGRSLQQFKGQATFIERDEAAHRAVLKAEGRDTGGRGNAAAEIMATGGEPLPHERHVRQRHHRPAITGKIAQFGRRIIGDVSKKLMDQFAGNLNAMLDDAATAADGADDRETAAGGRPLGRTAASDGRRPCGPTASRSAPRGPQDRRSRHRTGRPRGVGRPGDPEAPAAAARRARACWCVLAPTAALTRTARWRRPTVTVSARCSDAEPAGAFDVVVRDADGDPVVIRNAPLLDDGTPMPTRFWLVGRAAGEGGEPAGGRRRRARRRSRGRPRRVGRAPTPATPPSATRRCPTTPATARRGCRRHPRRREVPARPLRLVPGRR